MAKKNVADDFGIFLVSQEHLDGLHDAALDTASTYDRYSDAVDDAKEKLEEELNDPGVEMTPYVIYRLVPVVEISAVRETIKFIEKKL